MAKSEKLDKEILNDLWDLMGEHEEEAKRICIEKDHKSAFIYLLLMNKNIRNKLFDLSCMDTEF